MVNIKRYGQGQCIWCGRYAEGVDAEFVDGLLKGFLCKKHFWAAMQIRQANAEAGKTQEMPKSAAK